MIGETAPWKPLWISIYNAKCLTLEDYRHGRVLFAGDAAHLVPIFGVRGLNSGLDDAGNLAWKLALVLQGKSHDRLLDQSSQVKTPKSSAIFLSHMFVGFWFLIAWLGDAFSMAVGFFGDLSQQGN